MAGKKTAAAPAALQSTKAPRAKKPVATKPVTDEPKKRNMSAVSSEFVTTVQSNVSEDLRSRLKAKDVKELCEAFVKVLVDTVKTGKNVNFTNNMGFARRLRAARTYKNLKTQEKIEKAPHYVFTMTVKPCLKKAFDELPVDA